MLEVWKIKDTRISDITKKEDSLLLKSEMGTLQIIPVCANSARIMYSVTGEFSNCNKPGLVKQETYTNWTCQENDKTIEILLGELTLRINRETASITYCDQEGKILLRERNKYSKEMQEFEAFVLDDGEQEVKEVQTPDGVKMVVTDPKKISVGKRYHTRLNLQFENEGLYGLGQHEEGYANLRGKTVYVHQANRKIAIPLLVSSKGWGILSNSYSPLIFSDTENASYLYTEADFEMDYTFINGGNPDGVIKTYRQLSGAASMLPKWAFGYIQSQERYESSDEIMEVTQKTREIGAGIDCIVQDWLSWGENQWGQKTWDRERYPDPKQLTDDLHKLHTHLMISIWPNMDKATADYKEFEKENLLLPGSIIYNAFDERGQEIYKKQLLSDLWPSGVDAWWCDNCEPFTPEWEKLERPEPAVQYADYCRDAGQRMPAEQTNAFSLYHAKAVYDMQRSQTSEKRVCNLIRSGMTGQQKYGNIFWSGDIEATWDTLRKQIGAGLMFCASGMPYWTVDIGAFFVKTGNQWFWRGDYPEVEKDLGYRELYTRWFQWAEFLPVFRAHGTDCRREIYNFGEPGEMFYEALLAANKERYELMPYIYSLAGLVWRDNASMMRPMAFDYPDDENVRSMKTQYMFGPSMMICPVLKPIYYTENSQQIVNADRSIKVYLPEEKAGWYDFRSGKKYTESGWISVEVDMNSIPVFVKAGSIIPMTDFAPSTEEQTGPIKIKIYPGCDGKFTMYEDDGDGYQYEDGAYIITELEWKDKENTLYVNGEANKIFEVVVGPAE